MFIFAKERKEIQHLGLQSSSPGSKERERGNGCELQLGSGKEKSPYLLSAKQGRKRSLSHIFLIPCKAVGIDCETKTAGRELFTRIDFYSIPNISLHIPKHEDPGTQNLTKLFSARNTICYFDISGPFNGNSQIIISSSSTTTITTTITITVTN